MSNPQVTTIDQVCKIMTRVYMVYAESLTKQGNDGTPCINLAKKFCYNTEETYEDMSFMEGKLNKAIKSNASSIERLSAKIAVENNRFFKALYEEQLMMSSLLSQARDVMNTWFDCNEPTVQSFMAIGMPEQEGAVSILQVPADGETRSSFEDADREGPLFSRTA